MNKLKVFLDKEGNTLDVWFEEPREVICEETGDEVILKKDPRTNRVIGFEKLNFTVDKASDIRGLPVEVVIS
ncbi:MAG: DUF2283 domain-containing protein [Nitrospinae bacterium CG22_combo_CG10-13_8_21_14_all_47_10]|nr:MAG: DUF2283 domain-containing protein [Nitrospinae bacterium CG22_combo_CG10-13_8_21_14_all_47_10]